MIDSMSAHCMERGEKGLCQFCKVQYEVDKLTELQLKGCWADMKKWAMGIIIIHHHHHMKGLLLLLLLLLLPTYGTYGACSGQRADQGRGGQVSWNRGGGEGPILGRSYYYPFFTWENYWLVCFLLTRAFFFFLFFSFLVGSH
jgi:hypothetical protein